MIAGAAKVDAYLAALPFDQRQTLTALHATLHRLLPDHLVVMSYAMPGFRKPGPEGKMVASYDAFKHHLGLYPHSGSVIPAILSACAGFKISKSGVLFTPQRPLPDDLVRLIVTMRQTEIARGYGRR